MSPLVRSVLLTSLLTAASCAFAAAPDHANEAKSDCPREDAKPSESAKGDTPDRPTAAKETPAGAPDSPPASNNATAPAPAKPARPAAKQRPTWPPPPELIS